MLDTITEMYTNFLSFANKNQVVAAAVSLWGLAVVTFFFRTIPLRIYNFIKRQCTTTLVLNNYDSIYHEFLQWVSENNMHSFVRNLNFNNKGRWSCGVPMITIGYGRTFFFFNKRFFTMRRYKEEANQTMQVKESISITLLGRSHAVFSKLFDQINTEADSEDFLDIHIWKHDYWVYKKTQHKRSLDTVIIEKQCMDSIKSHVETFWDSKDWYLKYGIPYRTGIFFTGPAGTGKTSTIKALCSHYNKHLYIINLAGMTDSKLDEAMNSVPYGSVIAIEDIDTAGIGKRVENQKGKLVARGTTSKNNEENAKEESPENHTLSLGGILNAIDGLASSEGNILIATANNPDLLDKALLRPGRFDLTVEIGHMTDETMRNYLGMFFEDDLSEWHVKENIAPCVMPKLVSDNKDNLQGILNEIAIYKKRT